jgi:hypothetical protein
MCQESFGGIGYESFVLIFVALGFELGASHLLCRHSTTWPLHQPESLFFLLFHFLTFSPNYILFL